MVQLNRKTVWIFIICAVLLVTFFNVYVDLPGTNGGTRVHQTNDVKSGKEQSTNNTANHIQRKEDNSAQKLIEDLSLLTGCIVMQDPIAELNFLHDVSLKKSEVFGCRTLDSDTDGFVAYLFTSPDVKKYVQDRALTSIEGFVSSKIFVRKDLAFIVVGGERVQFAIEQLNQLLS